jgi:outer membrane murein-binding lipoprotein Lpp
MTTDFPSRNHLRSGGLSRHPLCVLACGSLLLLSGCFGKPNKANIDLRKQNAELSDKVAQLESQLNAQRATIRTMEAQPGATTVPTLSAERLEQLFTVNGISLGRLTGKADLGGGKQGLKVYVVPLDVAGDEIKAAGAFKVEAFNLTAADPRVGMWDFPVEEGRSLLGGSGLLYEYILPCPMDNLPASGELTVRVTFTDALTQRTLAEQKVIKLGQ